MMDTKLSATTQKHQGYWRSLIVVIASLFIIWQSLAIIIGPSPGSYVMGKVYPIFKPYLVALHLNNEWGFFAPDPARGTLLRYVVTDPKNTQHVFKLTENLKRSDHGFLRYTSQYLTIGRNNQNFISSATQYLCRRHQSLKPVQLQFFMGHQQTISPDEYVAGHRPLDDDFISIEYLTPMTCG